MTSRYLSPDRTYQRIGSATHRVAIRVGVALGGTAIGAPIVGWVANRFGPRWALGVGASSVFAAALVAMYILTQRTGLKDADLAP
jgi:MFS family permease